MLGCVPTSLLLTPAGCSTYEAQCTQAVTQRLCWVPPTAKQQQPQTASQANAVPQNQDPILENMDTLRGTQHCCASRHTHSQIVAHTHTTLSHTSQLQPPHYSAGEPSTQGRGVPGSACDRTNMQHHPCSFPQQQRDFHHRAHVRHQAAIDCQHVPISSREQQGRIDCLCSRVIRPSDT